MDPTSLFTQCLPFHHSRWDDERVQRPDFHVDADQATTHVVIVN